MDTGWWSGCEDRSPEVLEWVTCVAFGERAAIHFYMSIFLGHRCGTLCACVKGLHACPGVMTKLDVLNKLDVLTNLTTLWPSWPAARVRWLFAGASLWAAG